MNLPSVKGNVAAFVRDVVLGDSGIPFERDAGSFGVLAHALGKTNQSDAAQTYIAFRDAATGFNGLTPDAPALFDAMEAGFVAGQKGQEYRSPASAVGAK